MKYKRTFKEVSLFLILPLLYSCAVKEKNEKKNSNVKPNIIVIMADDMGYSDLGCYGSEISTPNLDSLAYNGLRITQFYNAGRCCPSRAALLTGLYPHQAGMGDMANTFPYNLSDTLSAIPAYQGFLPDNCVTIAEVLKGIGYNTLMSGKWHVGSGKEHWPGQRGFDRYFGLIHGSSSYFDPLTPPKKDKPTDMALNDELFYPEKDFYMTDAISEYAVKFLDQQKKNENPFFMYVAYTAPHWPLHALPEDIAKYRGKYMQGWISLRKKRYHKMLEMGLVQQNWDLSPYYKYEDWNEQSEEEKDLWDLRMAVYAAMIDRMDQGIGKILNKLRSMDEEKNTLIMFLSDNGASHEALYTKKNIIYDQSGETGSPRSWDSYGRSWANASNTPYKLFKHWTKEGGISTPFIAYFPGVIEKGKITNEPAHIIDIMATCIDYAGTSYPKNYKGQAIQSIEGKSLKPLFENENWEGHDVLFWEHRGNRAVRQGKWKLVASLSNHWELYNMEKDRTELEDISKKYPKKVAELQLLYQAWAQRVGVLPRKEIVELKKLYR